MTRYTSLVAVDETPVRPKDAPLVTSEVPRDIPEGWSEEKVFGTGGESEAVPAKPNPALFREAGLAPVKVSDSPVLASATRSVALPQTASPAMLRILIGLLLLTIAVLPFYLSNRARPRHA